MKYIEVKSLIKNELEISRDGLTWQELKERLNLPYNRLCPEWTSQLEIDIGLSRNKGTTRALIWTLKN